MNLRKKFRTLLASFLLIEIFLVYAQPVNAQNTNSSTTTVAGGAEQSIKDLLCTPTDTSQSGVTTTSKEQFAYTTYSVSSNAAGDDLYNCINRIYRFAIAFSSIAAVFMIVIAGYLYMASDGSEESVTKAKEILVSSITALVILFITFILLREINPELVKFKIIQPPSVTGGVPGSTGNFNPSGGGPTGRSFGNGKCVPITNNGSPASVANLKGTCFGSVAEQASSIANGESNGNPNLPVGVGACGSGSARCADGSIPVWGLYQINITVHKVGGLNCPAAFSSGFSCSKRNCRVVNQDLYNQCVAAAKNPKANIDAACEVKAKQGWNAWVFYQNNCKGKF